MMKIMNNSQMSIKKDNLIPIESNELFPKSQEFIAAINTSEMKNYMANQVHEQITKNLIQPSLNPPLKNLNEKVENLLEEQIKQYESANNELQKQLTEAQLQLKQLNDKESSQNLYIKELKADLKEESLKRELAENKLSTKDWKTAVIAFIFAVVVLAIEHWKDIYDFILSLIE